MKPIRTAILTASYACLAFLYVSCVREDTGDCMQYEIHVRVVDAAGNDLTQSGVLEKSEVYLFGENGFVRMVPAGVSSDYLFGNHKEARLTLVGTLEVAKSYAFLVTENRTLANDIFIPKEKLKGGKTGDKAIVKVVEWPDKAKNPIGQVIDILGKAGDNTRLAVGK
mgnify:CR=1 FL=1